MIITLTMDDVSKLNKYVDSSYLKRLDESRNFFFDLGDSKYFLAFHYIDFEKVAIYVDKNMLVVVTNSAQIMNCVSKLNSEVKGMSQLYSFFIAISSDDAEKLASLEAMISALENRLLIEKTVSKAGIKEIVKVREDFLKIKHYYVQMEFLTDEIAVVDSNFTYIDKKFDRLLEFIIHLQEYIEQVREAYQSQIDIEQNDIMKVFTVITSLFLPLTLITGWYGMNLQMPEFGWRFGYYGVMLLSVAVVTGLLIFFKKKKWF